MARFAGARCYGPLYFSGNGTITFLMVVRFGRERVARGREDGRPWMLLLTLLGLLTLTSPACAELELLAHGSSGGPGPPPSGSLSVSFIDVGQGDGVLVQAGGESYLIDAGRPEEGPNVVDFLRSRGVDSLEGIVVTNPRS